MKKVIGTVTTYHGTEHAYLDGYRLKIVGVMRAAADPDGDDYYVTDDDHLARLGGLSADDRVEVQPWIEKEGRFSFVASDPRVRDLEGYETLIG